MTNSDDANVGKSEAIVGKSVEEIEQESSNRVNSPVQGEGRHDSAGPLLIPGLASGGTTGAGGSGGVNGMGVGLPGVMGALLTHDEVGTTDGRGSKDTDTSEE